MADYVGAPYNFVPLPQKARPAYSPPPANIYHSDRLSGYFDCTLTTLTPVYTRSTLTLDEYKSKIKREADKNYKKEYKDDKAEFFQPGSMVRLPGSSLRGMIRNLVEIIGDGQFLNYSDDQLFYRAVGGRVAQSIVQKYRDRVKLENTKTVYAGYMVKEGSIYKIYPAKTVIGYDFFQIYTLEADRIAHAPRHARFRNEPEWKRMEIWYKLPTPGKFRPRVTEIESNSSSPGSGWDKGWLVISGYIPRKQRSWIIPEKDTNHNGIEIPLEDVLAYRDGGGLTDGIKNNFTVLPEDREEWPCFFIEWKDQKGDRRVSFGHTAYFRLPYENRPGDLLKTQLPPLKEEQLDLAEAIFGTAAHNKKGSFAGRVFFEDGTAEGTVQWESPEIQQPQILSSPKPTTFQHYLDQSEAEAYTNSQERMGRLKFWDSPKAQIRGYKMYWHRPGADWKANENDLREHPSQYTQLRPLAKDNVFKFKVRFDNLSEVELGVLAAALQLPLDCAHKLGMGKPLGLVSVRIQPTLHLINRKERYQSLFSFGENNSLIWVTGEQEQISDIQYYQDKFAGWLGGKGKKLTDLWESGRFRELKALLDFMHAPQSADTRYMTIEPNEFKERPILPPASQIWAKSQPKPAERDLVPEAEGDSSIEASLEDLQRLKNQFKKK